MEQPQDVVDPSLSTAPLPNLVTVDGHDYAFGFDSVSLVREHGAPLREEVFSARMLIARGSPFQLTFELAAADEPTCAHLLESDARHEQCAIRAAQLIRAARALGWRPEEHCKPMLVRAHDDARLEDFLAQRVRVMRVDGELVHHP